LIHQSKKLIETIRHSRNVYEKRISITKISEFEKTTNEIKQIFVACLKVGEYPMVQGAVLNACNKLKIQDPQISNAYIELFRKESNPYVKDAFAVALTTQKIENKGEITKIFENIVQDRSQSKILRHGVATALANWGVSNPSVIEMLIEEMNNDTDPKKKIRACESLATLQTKSSLILNSLLSVIQNHYYPEMFTPGVLKAAIKAINALAAVHAEFFLTDSSYLDVLNEQFEVSGRKGYFENQDELRGAITAVEHLRK